MKVVLFVDGFEPTATHGLLADQRISTDHGTRSLLIATAICKRIAAGAATAPAPGLIAYLEPEVVEEQIRAAFELTGVHAIKIGPYIDERIAGRLVSLLGELFDGPVVCDPPPPFDSAARGNSALSNNAALHRLFTRCRLITPTRPVAAALENSALSTRQQVRNASKSLRFLGSRAVLIRDTEPRALGAHVLFDGIQIHEFVAPKQGIDQRGLASAIACALAFNLSLPEAVTNAAAYMRKQSVSAEPR